MRRRVTLTLMANAPLRLFAISGSLRNMSSNTAILRAAGRVAPQRIAVTLFDELGELPPFNPDCDGDDPPNVVASFRARVYGSDGNLISTPEIALGIPGTLKNAL